MIRRLFVVLAFLAATVLVSPAAPAPARACTFGFECYTTFYSDPSHTSVVGSLYEDCQGEPTMLGTRSAFKTFQEYPCPR
ncbi:DUF6289 family protein [Salinispora oceanensis]|uniref:DUF6289 family protein n=1 Tax=Salinispora oceanensis TaxID=1050199 RepID=UPI000360E6A1|nr:DUF6289 family protein [Salinispora oceanensis]